MTIPNRTVSITGVFAEDALTTIPATPVPGTSYRDTAMTSTAIREGWAFKTIVDSAKFNQALYEYSSVTSQVEKYGFLPWSSLTDYVQGSVVLGSNGMLYQAKQATGPSTTAVDPTTDSTVWQQIILGNTNSLFDHKWSDYEITRQDWLRADTFSWQPGTTYTEAYNHLVDDIDGKTATTETIGSYTISYYLADDGHKITTDETTVANIYNESGVAWYYVLDTVNTRFKLPRTKYGFTGLRDAVGKYVPESLPNVKGEWSSAVPSGYEGYCRGAITSTTSNAKGNGTGTDGTYGYLFNASNSSSTYQDSAPVQQRATQMYLYFYVGNYTQSATEQTAGLNAELFNGKVDLNLNNMNPSVTAKETIVGWGMPDYSNPITLGVTSYTATENGWIKVNMDVYEGVVSLSINGTEIATGGGNASNNDQKIFPIKSGDTAVSSAADRILLFFPCIGG